MSGRASKPPIEWWGGVECTVNRVGDRWFDQLFRTGHDWRDADLETFATLGISAIRYPVLWERHVASQTDDLAQIDWQWTDRRLAQLRCLGIRPIVGLVHHGSGPAHTSLLDADFPDKLARFAGAVARRYPWISDFTPINEPLTTARFSALYGHWYPHARSDAAFVCALTTQVRGIIEAMRAIRAVTPTARLIQTEDCGAIFGTPGTESQVTFENHRRWLTWDLLTGAVGAAHPLLSYLRASGFTEEEQAYFLEHSCRPDVAGLNYYLTSDRFLDTRLSVHPPHTHGGNGTMAYADVEAVRGRVEGIAGHQAHLTEAWERYHIPVALTEVHLACTREEQMRWLAEAWAGARAAQADGVEVAAVTAWALLGSYDWNSLVTRDGSHYESGVFDVRSAPPRRTALADLVAKLSTGQTPSHPVFDVDGWWRRPERLADSAIALREAAEPARADQAAHAVVTRSSRPRQPLLIVGASGTLARAFQRLCAVRGLPAVAVGRHELDVTNPEAMTALIARLRPWAVINTTGYVRVDDAESDPASCVAVNTTGPALLAACCEQHGLPFVTYSSDLVFDGAKRAPYNEADVPNPLNVYGVSKAEAERAVLAAAPSALVIRTSAFFGPWDRHNFLAHLFDTLDRGRVFEAASDAIVSPTYVPDLVHASLDLLIDGDGGTWHLANDGSLSWYDFAMLAAAKAGRRLDLIRAVTTDSNGYAAARPRFSALTSRRGQLLRPIDLALAAFLHESSLESVVL